MASDLPLIGSDCLPHQVHEGQAADAMTIIKHEMEHVWIAKLHLPVAVTFGPSWAEMAPW